MTKRQKRLQRIRQNIKSVRFAELDIVLKDFGFMPDFTAGSHITYRHQSGARVTIASHKQHLPAYIVKQALKAIDESAQTTDDETHVDEEDTDADDE